MFERRRPYQRAALLPGIASTARPTRLVGLSPRRERQLGTRPPASQPAVVRGQDDPARRGGRAPPPAHPRGQARRGWSARRAAAGRARRRSRPRAPSRRRWPTDRLPTGVRWSRGCSRPELAQRLGRRRGAATATSYVASAERAGSVDLRVLGELADRARGDLERCRPWAPAGRRARRAASTCRTRWGRSASRCSPAVRSRRVHPHPPGDLESAGLHQPPGRRRRSGRRGRSAAPAACAPARARRPRAAAGRPSCAGRGSAPPVRP